MRGKEHCEAVFFGSCIVEVADVSLSHSVKPIRRAVKVGLRPVDRSGPATIVDKELDSLEIVRKLPEHRCLVSLVDYQLIPVPENGVTAQYLVTIWPIAEQNLEKCVGIEVDDLLRHLADAAEALDFLHSRNVIHRDVKPNNIFLLWGEPTSTSPSGSD